MKLTRQNLGNVAIAGVAVLLFATFVVLGTRGGSNNNKKLATVGTTTSTERVTTTTTEPDTTTSSTELATTTTTAAAVTTTTAKKSTTNTTARATTTTGKFACPARGPLSHEANDNNLSFTHAQDGSVSENSTGGSNSGVVVTIHAARADVSNDPAKVKFILKVENKSTTHCIYFPPDPNNGNQDVANITVTLTGLDPFVVSGGVQAPLQPGEALMITQERSTPTGTFSASVNCDVNYS